MMTTNKTENTLTDDDVRELHNWYAGLGRTEKPSGQYMCQVALGERCVVVSVSDEKIDCLRYPTTAERLDARRLLVQVWNDNTSFMAGKPEPVGEVAYLDLLRRILECGERRTNRTGTDTLSLFGAQMRFDLRQGFPLLTTKKVHFSAVVRELLWFLRGSTNIHDDLTQHTKIWDAWADEDGDLGPVYGFQWRHWGADSRSVKEVNERRRRAFDWKILTPDERESRLAELKAAVRARSAGAPGTAMADPGLDYAEVERETRELLGIDQIARAIHEIKTNPDSRRIIVSAWNVADVPKMRLPPCHLLFQFNVVAGHLDCQLYQRSADMALGVPFNIASYALLLSMIAKECGLIPRHFVHSLGDAHIYVNHVDGVRTQLERAMLPLPKLVLADKPVLEQTFEDIWIDDYCCHPAIRFEVAV